MSEWRQTVQIQELSLSLLLEIGRPRSNNKSNKVSKGMKEATGCSIWKTKILKRKQEQDHSLTKHCCGLTNYSSCLLPIKVQLVKQGKAAAVFVMLVFDLFHKELH